MTERVSAVEVEIDEADCAELGLRYQIRTIPTLMTFRRSIRQKDALTGSQITRASLKSWLQDVAEQGKRDRL